MDNEKMEESALVRHARREFKAAGWEDNDDKMQKLLCEGVLDLLRLFSTHDHSGSSAPYAINLFCELAKFNPIAPLTGEDDEWGDPYSEDGTQQNNRDSEVFRKSDGGAYWISGKIFRDSEGCTFTSKDSRVPITFPWKKPKPELVDVT